MIENVVVKTRSINRFVCDCFNEIFETLLRATYTAEQCIEMLKYIENVSWFNIIDYEVISNFRFPFI